jgi:aspartate aminotransferase
MGWQNSTIAKIKPSETLAVKERATKLQKEGRKIINLGPGEPDLDTPEFVKEAAIKALHAGKTRYTPVAGIPELRSAIAKKLQTENDIPARANDIIVTTGAKQALFACLSVICEGNDEVLFAAPYWVSYPEMAILAGARPIVMNPGPGYRITPELLRNAITPHTKALIINSPSNPAGIGYTKAELATFGALLADFPQILIISDEIYEKVLFPPFVFTSFAAAAPVEVAKRTVTVNGFSKAFAMTGWRLGYAHGPEEVIDAMIRHQNQTTSNANSIAQYAALAALEGDTRAFIQTLNTNFQRRLARVKEILSSTDRVQILVEPNGAFYLMLSLAPIIGRSWKGKVLKNSTDITNYLLDEAGVAVVPGAAFGADECVRISIAASDAEVEEGVQKIVAAAQAL